MIYVETAAQSDIVMDYNEIFRYLGYQNNTPEDHVKAQIEAVTEEVFSALNCYACLSICDISVTDDTVDLGVFSAPSRHLAKTLSGCRQAVLFCATIGAGVDRIIAKYSQIAPSSAVIAQAAGAAAIEGFCDVLCQRILERQPNKNCLLRPRFSPGYGDFPLAYQKEIFRVLSCTKRIGVSLTESLMMTPTKSVSAIVGIA